ncbi:hypothetical protein ABB37_01099 [Leptomonas pyrrhocoris]|uniref:Uncharacterized protein n=1 Tax=Leptomonas pyrrhocoris TaxID=157538 RepID=A0A0N1J598_LEPPY|nr:hypothetical protein ABB37_01099 [Leptomonas pyrrhocoris]KPA84564.1 hypothetical protein ABB37_01099 [Leptomonas pyrrhocoris]|eukprot:XP_015663003.1 hypothetical protein ABB37_01099 [Leptomonas pyrrhocoris]
MQGRGMGRGSRPSYGADGGLCSLHGKRRAMHDLIPWSQQPGKFRCLPHKECQMNRDRRHSVGGPGGDRGERTSRGRGGGAGGVGVRGRLPMAQRGRGAMMRDRVGAGRGGMRMRGRRGDFRMGDRRDHGGAIRGESAICRLHQRRRPMGSLREVGAGVYECVEGSRCRQTMDRPMRGGLERRGRVRDNRGPSALYRTPNDRDRLRPVRRGDRAGPPPQDQRFYDANASAWTPSAGAGAGGGGGVRRRYGRVERKVWCALHGKSLPISLCEFLQDSCYVCRDPSTCLSTPLEEDTNRLVSGKCVELLCSLHHTLRHVGFLELNEKKVAYQCIAGHACRGVTVPHLGRDPAAAAEVKAPNAPAGGDVEDDDGIYMGPRVANTFLPQNGREAVSSFFM